MISVNSVLGRGSTFRVVLPLQVEPAPEEAADWMALDTLKVARRLREAGFSEPQTEAVLATVQEAEAGADRATRADRGRDAALS